MLLVYVDELVISGNSSKLIVELKHVLVSSFKMKDLGESKYFLGIEIAKSKMGIFLNQRQYALELISSVGMSAGKIVKTPLELNLKLTSIKYDEHLGVNKD